jgi:threonine/homoserine/homoserine lactone efflux protein
MFKVIAEGLVYGIFLSILVGPLLVTLVNTSIKHGIKKGLYAAGGIWLSDILFIIAVAYLSLRFEDIIASKYLVYGAWVTAIVFIVVGLLFIIKKEEEIKGSKWELPSNDMSQFFKGFLVNTINPFTLVFWTTLATNQAVLKGQPIDVILVFFMTILFVIILTDTLKVLLANRITYFLKSRSITYFRLFSGVVFLLSGIYIVVKFCL